MNIKLLIDPTKRTNPPAYTQDSAADLVSWYQSAVNSGQTMVPSADCGNSSLSNMASVVLRAIVDSQPAQEVTIVCRDGAEAKVYAQMYNFWFAGTKAERLEVEED
ncbi:hypothetical protein RFF05_07680 [Bengtsoniella intestinalis]|uniref:hypothetical protein n=1 Tax=Bengtsoniella intestinalis TaxID=3073143 RepID=UPI00391F7CAF